MSQAPDAGNKPKPVYPIEVSSGDRVGRCSECGPVVRDNVNMQFPNPPECGLCGRELEKATVASHDTRITQPRR
jgi:hypothetical protein